MSHLLETNQALVSTRSQQSELANTITYLNEKYLELQNATSNDPDMEAVHDAVLGWPNSKAEVQVENRQYWTFREEVSCIDSLLFKGKKLIVPHALRLLMLEKIHKSHQRIDNSTQHARDVLLWPRMATQIEERMSKLQVQPKEHKSC